MMLRGVHRHQAIVVLALHVSNENLGCLYESIACHTPLAHARIQRKSTLLSGTRAECSYCSLAILRSAILISTLDWYV